MRLDRAVERALADGHFALIEVSPHPVLAAGLQDTPLTVLGTLRRDEDGPHRLLLALAEAHVHGIPVRWDLPRGPHVLLPTYAFQHESFWLAGAAAAVDGATITAAGLDATTHPLLGAMIPLPDGGAMLTGRLSVREQGWLADHAVRGSVLVPGTAFVDLVVHAGDQVECPHLAELTVLAPLSLPDDGTVRVQVTVAADREGRREVDVFARHDHGEWTHHASGVLTAEFDNATGLTGQWPPAGAEPVDLAGFYPALAAGGIAHGPAFQGLRAAWRRSGEVFAEIATASDVDGFTMHPALLDAALHAAALPGAVPALDADGPYLPFAWSGVTIHASGATSARVRLTPTGPGTVAVLVTDVTGAPVATVEALTLRPTPRPPLTRCSSWTGCRSRLPRRSIRVRWRYSGQPGSTACPTRLRRPSWRCWRRSKT